MALLLLVCRMNMVDKIWSYIEELRLIEWIAIGLAFSGIVAGMFGLRSSFMMDVAESLTVLAAFVAFIGAVCRTKKDD